MKIRLCLSASRKIRNRGSTLAVELELHVSSTAGKYITADERSHTLNTVRCSTTSRDDVDVCLSGQNCNQSVDSIAEITRVSVNGSDFQYSFSTPRVESRS